MLVGQTIIQKILSKTSGRSEVSVGDIVQVEVAAAMTHDVIGPQMLPRLLEITDKVWDPERILMSIDHYVPPSTLEQADLAQRTTEYARKLRIKHFYPYKGISHQLLCESGLALPGRITVGTDSHTVVAGALGAFGTALGATEMIGVFLEGKTWFKVPPTIRFNFYGSLPPGVGARDVCSRVFQEMGKHGAVYRALEFAGPVIRKMSVDERMVLSVLSVDIGAKAGIAEPDEKVTAYMRDRTNSNFDLFTSDQDAEFECVYNIDVTDLEPLVAVPDHPANLKPVSQVEGVAITQAFIGSCPSGRFEDLRIAAEMLKGREVHPDVKFVIVPASQEQFLKAERAGFIEVFLSAGAIVAPPGCGACVGMQQGVLADNEVMIATQPRNNRGRSGSRLADIYLASPYVVAASAVAGQIADPRRFI